MSLPDFDKINRKVKNWEIVTLAEVKSAAKGMGVRHRSNSNSSRSSVNSMRTKDKKRAGDLISAVSFVFNRSLIYSYYGAGKGRGGRKGSSWVDKYGKRHKTNPKSLGKAGTGGRKEKPFFDEINEHIDKLALEVAEETGQVVASNIFGNTKTAK